MVTLEYNIDIKGLQTFKNDEDIYQNFFYSGHPGFLIPDFFDEVCDIFTSFPNYLEKKYDTEIYDQNGGEITSYNIINKDTGLTRCLYTAYDVMLSQDSDEQDYEVEITGYVVNTDEPYFLATKVAIK